MVRQRLTLAPKLFILTIERSLSAVSRLGGAEFLINAAYAYFYYQFFSSEIKLPTFNFIYVNAQRVTGSPEEATSAL